MNYRKIKELQEQRKVSNRKIAKAIGMSDVGYGKMLENSSCDVATIELIAEFFNKPISYFFDKEEKQYATPSAGPDVANEGGGCCRRCKDLEKQIELLEKLLAVYENTPKKENLPKTGT